MAATVPPPPKAASERFDDWVFRFWKAGAAVVDIALTVLAPSGDETVSDGYSAYVPDYYEIASGQMLEIGNGSIMEIG